MLTTEKLVLNTIDSIHFIQLEDILYGKSNNSYTTFYLANQEPIVVSRNIKEFEAELSHANFFRTHQSYLVNLRHLKKIDKKNGFALILSDNSLVPTSIRRKKALMQILGETKRFQNEK